MSKAKTASKNNPSTRGQAKEYFHMGMKILPVKLITEKSSYFAAEYEKTGDLVVGTNNIALPWDIAKNLG
ncbi:MAG: hypothetical protein EOP33_03200 [Rickettsiaceae bacterium]|nr:MAG: hypothetical protein EOP33_03200 [Rickettsiaceae bacterium]